MFDCNARLFARRSHASIVRTTGEACVKGIRTDALFASSISAMMVVVMMVVVVVTVPARLDADMNASAMMVVVMMVMSDYDLGGLRAATLCQTLIIGLQ
jgi:hypothetical protein